MIGEILRASKAGLWDRPRLRCLAKPERTIFWTLWEEDYQHRRTHPSNWIWRVEMLKGEGAWMATSAIGELVKANGTKADKIAWGNTIRAIEDGQASPATTNKGRYIDERF